MRSRVGLLVVGVSLVAYGAVWASEPPVTVSPGSATGSLVEGRCPAFSWGEVEGAKSYELVVYRLGEQGAEAKPVLRKTLPGSASSWTPSLDRCLERGGQYAWSVRAVGRKEASNWSAPNLFEVVSGPSGEEFEAALRVVRSYLEAGGGAASLGGAVAETRAGSESKAGPEASGSSPVPAAVGTTQLNVDGGVLATSFTGDGSTLTDLDPTELSAGTAGIDISGAAGSASDVVCTDCVSETELDFDPATQGELDTHGGLVDAHHTLPTDLPPSGAAGGDLAGTYPDPTVVDAIARDAEVSALLGGLSLCPAAIGSTDRFTDCGNGTVRDNNTGLIWLKNANCFGMRDWPTAIADADTLASGACGLTDGSVAGQWHLARIEEFCSQGEVIAVCPTANAADSLMNTNFSNPTLSNAKGDAQWTEGNPFTGVQWSAGPYFSANEFDATNAWRVSLTSGGVSVGQKGDALSFVWPVRTPADAEWEAHAGDADAHREHATLEESAEIDADISVHAALSSGHHLIPTALPPSGPAGGDLVGSYPSPAVASNAVASDEIVDGSVAEGDLAFDPATQAELDAALASGSTGLAAVLLCDGVPGGWRYFDLGDGTVLDCNTRKIWLKDASCLGQWPYENGANPNIFTKVADLNIGTDFSCSGYTAGTYADWEVPAMASMCGLWNGSCTDFSCCTASQGIVDTSVSGGPSVANGKGDAAWTPGNVFVGVQSNFYWSATEDDASNAWGVNLTNGFVIFGGKVNSNYVWPVRGGQ